MNALFFPGALTAIIQSEVYLYLQLASVFTLLLLLILRELAHNIEKPFAHRLWSVTLIGIVPLLFAFLLIVSWHLSLAE